MQRFRWGVVRRVSMRLAVLSSLVCSITANVKAEEPDRQKPSLLRESSPSREAGAAQAPLRQPNARRVEHPEGPGKWKEWGIEPRTLTRQEEWQVRSLINDLLDPRSESYKEVLLEVAGRKKIDKARPLLDVLGVESLPNERTPGSPSMRLPQKVFRSIEGFVPLGRIEEERYTPDGRFRVTFDHSESKERVRVSFFYADSPAGALAHFISWGRYLFSSEPGLWLLRCRIMHGPGDFCWLRWSRTNQFGTLYFPVERSILFLREGVAVRVSSQDWTAYESVMDLARKIDALLIEQAKRAKEQAPKQGSSTQTDERKKTEKGDAALFRGCGQGWNAGQRVLHPDARLAMALG